MEILKATMSIDSSPEEGCREECLSYHLEAKISLFFVFFCLLVFVFFLKKYAIRALLSTSNIDSFPRKLLDSESSGMTKRVVF